MPDMVLGIVSVLGQFQMTAARLDLRCKDLVHSMAQYSPNSQFTPKCFPPGPLSTEEPDALRNCLAFGHHNFSFLRQVLYNVLHAYISSA